VFDERWSDDAEELGRGLRGLLAKECTTSHVREAEASPDGRDRALEAQLDAFGLSDLPSEPQLLARAALEIGRALVPATFVETTPAAVVLGRADTAYGFDGPVPASVTDVAVRVAGGVAVIANDGRTRRSAAGDFLTMVGPVPTLAPVADDDAALRMWRLARLLDAARLVGAGQALLEVGVEYAKERVQFGRAIGSFQGVAYRLVDATVALDAADLLVRKAAFLASSDADGDGAPPLLFAIMARAKAVEASRRSATTVHQVMGGYGFAMEYPCQLYSRRIRSWSQRLGSTGTELATLARALLDPKERDQVRHLWGFDIGMPLPRWAREATPRTDVRPPAP